MKILVTGFDPFGGEPINPAIESVKRLPDNIAGAEIIKLEIPTVRKKSLEKIEEAIDEPIFPDGENAYLVKLPVKAMVQNIQKNNIPASVSYTAGTFVCNHVLYGVLYLIEKKYKGKKSGFIHIPFLPEQVVDKRNTPSMELSTIVKGLTAAIEAIVKNDEDIKEVGGTVC